MQLLGDWVHQFASATGMVLDAGRRVLVYSGKDDYICNYLGGAEWTNVTQWKQQVVNNCYRCGFQSELNDCFCSVGFTIYPQK